MTMPHVFFDRKGIISIMIVHYFTAIMHFVQVVECMLDQVSTMEGNLARLKKGDMRIPIHRHVLLLDILYRDVQYSF